MEENRYAEEERIYELRQTNPRFRQLYEHHRILEDRIAELERHKYRSTDIDLEIKKMKKMKLVEKDEMEKMIKA